MKINKFIKILFCAVFSLLFCLPAEAQQVKPEFYVGVRGGIGGGTISTRRAKKAVFGFPEGGLSVIYKGRIKYFDALQGEVNYARSGFRWLAKAQSDSSYTRTIDAVEIPFMWHPNITMFRENFSIFLNAGPYVSYAVSSHEYYRGDDVETSTWRNRDNKYEFNPGRDNRLGYGLLGGVGVSYLIGGRVLIQAEARFKWEMNDLFKNQNHYILPTQSESQISQYRVSLGIYYRFGEKRVRQKREKKIDTELIETDL